MAAPDGTPRLLTLGEAADALGVSRAAVHQMLEDYRLDGPSFKGRAPKGVGRVTPESVARVLAARTQERGPGRPRRDHVGSEVEALRAEVARLRTDLKAAIARSRASDDQLLRMKIAADDARAAARAARASNQDLLRQMAALVKTAQDVHGQADTADDIAQGYSDTLTSLLVPDTADGLGP